MHFIEAFKLKNRLLLLFMLITVGLVAVGIIGALHIKDMKKNIDLLYFGSLVPVTELNEIMNSYHNGLSNTLYRASRKEISSQEAMRRVERSIEDISKLWKSYESHYKHRAEGRYLEYTRAEIQRVNSYFMRIYEAAKGAEDLSKLSLRTLERRVSIIDTTIEKLIRYEIDVARYERELFIKNYEESIRGLGFFLLLLILGLLSISWYVFRTIQNEHLVLEKTTDKLTKANKQLENVSYRDALTGLFNRRYFDFVYINELNRAKRARSYISFMMLDIDFFKQYNDTYGHLAGDEALKCVAKVLQETLRRPSDYLFRLGGEEFGVLISESDESSSAELARDLCRALKEREIAHASSDVHEYVTISIGVVCCVADEALDAEILLSRADDMLYRAKESGRDRYEISSDISSAITYSTEEEEKSA